MEQVGLLADDADVGDERLLLQLANVVPGEPDAAAGHVVEPRDEIGDRGLAGTGRPHECRELAGLDVERDPLEGRRGVAAGIRIRENDVLELDPAEVATVHGVGVRGVDDGRHEVEVLEDAGEQRLRGLQVERDAHEAEQRPHQPRLHRRECDDRAGGHGAVPAEQQPGRADVDDRGNDGQEDLHHREEPLAAHLLAHLQPHLVVVLAGVPADLGLLLVEALREEDAGD